MRVDREIMQWACEAAYGEVLFEIVDSRPNFLLLAGKMYRNPVDSLALLCLWHNLLHLERKLNTSHAKMSLLKVLAETDSGNRPFCDDFF